MRERQEPQEPSKSKTNKRKDKKERGEKREEERQRPRQEPSRVIFFFSDKKNRTKKLVRYSLAYTNATVKVECSD